MALKLIGKKAHSKSCAYRNPRNNIKHLWFIDGTVVQRGANKRKRDYLVVRCNSQRCTGGGFVSLVEIGQNLPVNLKQNLG